MPFPWGRLWPGQVFPYGPHGMYVWGGGDDGVLVVLSLLEDLLNEMTEAVHFCQIKKEHYSLCSADVLKYCLYAVDNNWWYNQTLIQFTDLEK